jgi:hypothetical protein
LAVIAAINPQFAADPFDEGSNNPHLPVRFLRYAAQVFLAVLKSIRSRPPRNAVANFALAQNYFIARIFCPERVEDGGRL